MYSLRLYIFFIIVGVFFFTSETYLYAGEATIVNEVSVSATTGASSGGVIQEGDAEVRVRIEQEVNGVKQEPIVVIEKSDGSPIVRDIHVESQDGTAVTDIHVSASGEDRAENVLGETEGATVTREKHEKEEGMNIGRTPEIEIASLTDTDLEDEDKGFFTPVRQFFAIVGSYIAHYIGLIFT